LDGYVPGVYAIKVSGQLPDEIRTSLEDEYRIQYIPYVDYRIRDIACLVHGESSVADFGYRRDGTQTEADA
jgi:transcription elongation factor SPT4